MNDTLLPLAQCPRDTLRSLNAVLSDLDDTLTLEGRITAHALGALERLQAAGIRTIIVSGRPGGWCDHIARMWPVDAVVGENGAFYFRYDAASRKMIRVYAQKPAEREANRGRLMAVAGRILRNFPGTALASDQAYREIDVAIDFREDVPPQSLDTADAIRRAFETEGATAKVSSIHVNAWFGDHDKLTMAHRCLADCFGLDTGRDRNAIAYAGDSPNDSPMFAHFPNSFGVANVLAYRLLMPHLPRYVTVGEGGHGFGELARAILETRHGKAIETATA
jgi:HAD superfamily hydrolase (TIGR01484 family)